MAQKEYQELGSTAACVMRGVSACGDYVPLVYHMLEDDAADTQASKDLFLGDSWFGSVNYCAAISKTGHHD